MSTAVVSFNPSLNVPARIQGRELSALTQSLAGTSGSGMRIGLENNSFHLFRDGKEVAAIEERFLDIVIVASAPTAGRTFYGVEYVKGMAQAVDEAICRIDSGLAQVIFLLNPTRLEQVKAVAAAGEKMPLKSTFFYPKVYTGLTVYKF